MDEKNNNNQAILPDVADTCVKCDAGRCSGGCCSNDVGRCNLTSTNWLEDVPDNDFDIVEVLFKNTRRGFTATVPTCPSSRAIGWQWRPIPAMTSAG